MMKRKRGDEELMKVADRLYELTNNIDNIGLYDPLKRRKEEEALKIEYHSNIAKEEEAQSIAKNLLNMNLSVKDIMKATGLSQNQITMLM